MLLDRLRDNNGRRFDLREQSRRCQDWSEPREAWILIWSAWIFALFFDLFSFDLELGDLCDLSDSELVNMDLSCDLSEGVVSASNADALKAVASHLDGSLGFDLNFQGVEAGLKTCFGDCETSYMLTVKFVLRGVIIFLKRNLVHLDPALVFSEAFAS